MDLSLRVAGRLFKIGFFTRKIGGEYVSGITNRCHDGQYCLFLDYDDVPSEWIIEELKFIQKEFVIGDIHVFRTGRGFHTICTQKRTLRGIMEIMRACSIEQAYLDVPLQQAKKLWTLRITEKAGKKPEYICTLPGALGREESHPHNELLRKIYNLTIKKDYEDSQEEFYTGHYFVKE